MSYPPLLLVIPLMTHHPPLIYIFPVHISSPSILYYYPISIPSPLDRLSHIPPHLFLFNHISYSCSPILLYHPPPPPPPPPFSWLIFCFSVFSPKPHVGPAACVLSVPSFQICISLICWCCMVMMCVLVLSNRCE